MTDAPPPAASPLRPLLIVGACLAAYGLFWLGVRPLLPARILADRTVGMLPTLVVTAACVSLLRRNPRGPLLAFGATAALLAVFAVLVKMIF